MIPCRTILLAVLGAVAVPAYAGPGSYSITPAEIAAAISTNGLEVSANQVSLLANVVASVPQPALRLASVRSTADHLLMARMECSDSAQCLPFMVELNVDGSAMPPAPAKSIARTPRPSQPARLLVHSGSTSTLLLEGPHVQIKIAVICLQNGSIGEMVRAANPDRSQFYTVQVLGENLLRGKL